MNVGDGFLSLYSQCCVDTSFAHTLFSYSSGLQWVKGAHSIKFGGEQRVFFNNFHQPDYPTGNFDFSRDVTTQQPNAGLGDAAPCLAQGNPFATMLTGFAANDSVLHIVPAVSDKSAETAFYVQDDWKVTPKLTRQLWAALRVEHSVLRTLQPNSVQRFQRLYRDYHSGRPRPDCHVPEFWTDRQRSRHHYFPIRRQSQWQG